MTRIDPQARPAGGAHGDAGPASRRWAACGAPALLFLLVIGGLYVGWFSPTEAASIGAVGAFVLGLVNRKIAARSCSGRR